MAKEALPFPVDSGCSGTFIPATSYPGNLGISFFLPSPRIAEMRRDTMKPDLFGGLYWGSKNRFAHWERSSLILAQPCESEVMEAYRLWKVQLKIK